MVVMVPTPKLTPTQTLKHYENGEYGFSIDYPNSWYSEYNQIQIGAYYESLLGSMPESYLVIAIESSMEQLCYAIGCINPHIYTNEPASGKWDWVATCSFTCEGTPVQMEYFIVDIQSIEYILTVIQEANMDWPEGQDVLNSLKIVN